MLSGHDPAGPLPGRSRDPGAHPTLRRRRADPLGGPRRGARGPDPERDPRGARREGEGARPRVDEHADGARWRRVHDAPAGPRLGADRPGHERPRLVRPHAAGVGAVGLHPGTARAVDRARRARRAPRVLRDHRGGRGLGRRRDRVDGHARRRRVRPARHEDARDLVQHGRLDLLPGQARRRRPRGGARALLRRQGHAGGAADRGAPVLAHLPGHPRAPRVRRRAGAVLPPRRRRGRRDVVHPRVVPVRAADDRGAVLRRDGAA